MQSLGASGGRKTILGMVHLRPLPGTPFHDRGSFAQIMEDAVRAARALHDGGADGCLVQTADRVQSVKDESDPARVAAVALIVQAIIQATGGDFQVGVQLMANAVRASLAVAKVAGGAFVRANAIVGMTLTAQGLIEAAPLEVMEYRGRIDAWDVKVVADVASMHFKWFGEAKPAAEVARSARLVGADAVCLGSADEQGTLEMIDAVRRACPGLPILLAGHTNHENAARLLSAADGAFVGTCLERGGWGGPIDLELVRSYIEIVRGLEG